MQEPYPNSVLSRILKEHKLSEPVVASLIKILTFEGMQTAIEEGIVEAASLLKSPVALHASYTIFSEHSAKEIIHLIKAIKTNPAIASKHIKVSELIFWFTYQNEALPYIASPTVAELLLAYPEKIEQLREFIIKNAAAMKVWVGLRKAILELNNIPRGDLNDRRLKAKEITEKLAVPETSDFVIDITGHESLRQEYRFLIKYLSQHLKASTEQLEVRSKEFMIGLLKKEEKIVENPKVDITFHSKPAGKQLGRIMQIKFKDLKDNKSKTIKYYIKTHLGGSSHSPGNIEGVDPKELFVYKVLEYIGYGPKTYFYTNPVSIAGFYIATQDVGFTHNPHEKTSFLKPMKN